MPDFAFRGLVMMLLPDFCNIDIPFNKLISSRIDMSISHLFWELLQVFYKKLSEL